MAPGDIAKTNGEVFREIFTLLDTQCVGAVDIDDAALRTCCLVAPCRPEGAVLEALNEADAQAGGAGRLEEKDFLRVLRRVTEGFDLRHTRESAMQVVRDLRAAKRRRFLMFADRATGAPVDQEQLARDLAGGAAALAMYLELFDYALQQQQALLDAAFGSSGSTAPSSAHAYAQRKALQDERSVGLDVLEDLLGLVCPDHPRAEVGEMLKVASLTEHGGVDSTEFILLLRGARVATPLSDMVQAVRHLLAAKHGTARPRASPPPHVRSPDAARTRPAASPPQNSPMYHVRETAPSPWDARAVLAECGESPPRAIFAPGGQRFAQHRERPVHPVPTDTETYRAHVTLGRGVTRRDGVHAEVEADEAREVALDGRRQALLEAMAGLDDVVGADPSGVSRRMRQRWAADGTEGGAAMAQALRQAIPVSLRLAAGRGGGGGAAGEPPTGAARGGGAEQHQQLEDEHRDALLASHARNQQSLREHADGLWEEATFRNRKLRPPPAAPLARGPGPSVASYPGGSFSRSYDPVAPVDLHDAFSRIHVAESIASSDRFPDRRSSGASGGQKERVGSDSVRPLLPIPREYSSGMGRAVNTPSMASFDPPSRASLDGPAPAPATPETATAEMRALRAAFLKALSEYVHAQVYPLYSTAQLKQMPMAVFDECVRDACRLYRTAPPAEPFGESHKRVVLTRMRFQQALREFVEVHVRPAYLKAYQHRFPHDVFERMVADAIEEPRRAPHVEAWRPEHGERILERLARNAEAPDRFAGRAPSPTHARSPSPRQGHSPTSVAGSYFTSPRAAAGEYRPVREVSSQAPPAARLRYDM